MCFVLFFVLFFVFLTHKNSSSFFLVVDGKGDVSVDVEAFLADGIDGLCGDELRSNVHDGLVAGRQGDKSHDADSVK